MTASAANRVAKFLTDGFKAFMESNPQTLRPLRVAGIRLTRLKFQMPLSGPWFQDRCNLTFPNNLRIFTQGNIAHQLRKIA